MSEEKPKVHLYLAFDSKARVPAESNSNVYLSRALAYGEASDAAAALRGSTEEVNNRLEKLIAWNFGVRPHSLRRLADKDPALIPIVGRSPAPENKK